MLSKGEANQTDPCLDKSEAVYLKFRIAWIFCLEDGPNFPLSQCNFWQRHHRKPLQVHWLRRKGHSLKCKLQKFSWAHTGRHTGASQQEHKNASKVEFSEYWNCAILKRLKLLEDLHTPNPCTHNNMRHVKHSFELMVALFVWWLISHFPPKWWCKLFWGSGI